MAKLVVLYKKPTDPKAFDDYYATTHIPLAKKVPGLKSYEVSDGPVVNPAGASPYHLVATLEIASMADLQSGLASAEGRAAAGDIAKFATGGVEMLVFDTKDA